MNTPQNGFAGGCIKDNQAAFTLTDLLVVLAVISLLAVLQLSAATGAKDQTKVGICANNLRQLFMATQIYATENKDKLPVIPMGAAAWAWDLPISAADVILNTGIQKKHFYCPGTSPRFTDKENWAAPGTASLWNFGVAVNFRVAGYAFAFSGASSTLSSTNRNTTMLPESTSTVAGAIPAAQRVLIADATISSGSATPGYLNPANNYTSIVGGFQQNGQVYPHLSPHLRGQIPLGGNVGFKDGHVAWRDFSVMVPRTTSGTYFWW